MAHSSPDLLFVPAHVLPPIHPDRTLVTIHDLGYLSFPRTHPWQQRLYLELSSRWNAHAAAHVLTDSRATKADLLTHYGIAPEKVTVAYPGTEKSLSPVHDADIVKGTKGRYDISGDYFLYLGTLQPRKNLRRLVEAFAHVAVHHASGPIQLVLAGKRGWLCKELFELIEQRGLEQQVRLPGYVAQEDKATLLSGAIAFVFPSLHEGFGLPVLEAQACGCPVITSNTSSLPEVAGDAALLVDPRDSAAIAEAMQHLAGNQRLRSELVERGFANVARFSWRRCAETVMKVIETHLC
jgi:glycosyltransferase involved in cell wall biosynthesis